ncbi:GntR family transcriptional regulator, partial [Pseudomonas syringae pv. spinaceae]
AGFHQPLGLQARHRFPNHGAADSAFANDYLLGGQLFAALDLAIANPAREFGDQLLGQAGTAAFGGRGVFHGKVIGPFGGAEYNRTRNVFCAGIAAYTRVSDRTEAAMSDNALSPQKNHRRLAETLVDRFAQRMRDGVLVRGEKLPSEIHIMEAEGVSRTVVRDALSRMQAAGLVETR